MILNTQQAADYLGISIKSLYKLIQASKADAYRGEEPRLLFTKVGGIKFRQEWLDNYIERGLIRPSGAKPPKPQKKKPSPTRAKAASPIGIPYFDEM